MRIELLPVGSDLAYVRIDHEILVSFLVRDADGWYAEPARVLERDAVSAMSRPLHGPFPTREVAGAAALERHVRLVVGRAVGSEMWPQLVVSRRGRSFYGWEIGGVLQRQAVWVQVNGAPTESPRLGASQPDVAEFLSTLERELSEDRLPAFGECIRERRRTKRLLELSWNWRTASGNCTWRGAPADAASVRRAWRTGPVRGRHFQDGRRARSQTQEVVLSSLPLRAEPETPVSS